MAGGLKTERSQQSAILTQQAWSMKDLLYGQKYSFFSSGNNAGNPKRGKMGPARVANQNAGFASSYPIADSGV